jgi:hypothetical protein
MAINQDLYQVKQQWCIDVINTAKANLLRYGKVNTGELRDSIRFVISSSGKISFYYAKYGLYVELGRRAGSTQPPINPILRWIQQRGINPSDGKSPRSLAFAIAKSIGDNGYAGVPFFRAAIKTEKKKLTGALKKAISKSIIKTFKVNVPI